ncbi:MAG: cobalt-precorrin-6A synthase, partial [Ruminococcus sp.]
GVKGILFIAHIGKFIKVAGGIMNTHSRNGDSRAELMGANALRAGASVETVKEILDSITTEQSIDILIRDHCLESTMEEVLRRVGYYLEKRAGDQLKVGAVLFSSVHGKLGQTAAVEELCTRIREEKNDREGE